MEKMHHNSESIKGYNPRDWGKDMEFCNPSILGPNTLMSGSGDFMTKEKIKADCKCINKAVCLQIVDLLSNNHINEAQDLIDTLQNGKE